ncbi:hypothetical protein CTAYLR_005700 [Chrysophaeum taylorii]|uniref:Uncharacterized protein n=1 Tax=Chrysophaeum taylorii TaxID=2483200 RepID=A0AAD7UAT3_9STRA|nr:hypothetical protein CTAYLR_005700 [Chrysophaeum taylorii]
MLIDKTVVTLDFRLMNWNFMNFKLSVPTSTFVFAIKQRLVERHGRIRDLVVCHTAFAQANEMSDDVKTLQDYGIRGAPHTEPPVEVPIFYEFKPCDHDDPLLLHLVNE